MGRDAGLRRERLGLQLGSLDLACDGLCYRVEGQ